MRARLFLAALAMVAAQAAFAVQPDEMLPDPALEARARAIGQVLRCPVCQGETIDESSAPISRDLRLFVRERLAAGDSDPQVIDAVTARFGEYVLFQPRAQGANLILYWAAPVMALIAALAAFLYLRARRAGPPEAGPALSEDERARLDALMRDQGR